MTNLGTSQVELNRNSPVSDRRLAPVADALSIYPPTFDQGKKTLPKPATGPNPVAATCSRDPKFAL